MSSLKEIPCVNFTGTDYPTAFAQQLHPGEWVIFYSTDIGFCKLRVSGVDDFVVEEQSPVAADTLYMQDCTTEFCIFCQTSSGVELLGIDTFGEICSDVSSINLLNFDTIDPGEMENDYKEIYNRMTIS